MKILLLALVILPIMFGCSPGQAAYVETRLFVDSAGREVQIPVQVNGIIPSGPYAQAILFTISPDMLLGISSPLTRVQARYFGEEFLHKPVFGRLFGGSFNVEAAMAARPCLIIDMGVAMPGIAADIESLQTQSGIPVIFIEATLSTMADAYDTLGEILGLQETAAEMSQYIRGVLDFAEYVRNKIPEDERPRVLYAQGEFGEEVFARGSVHSEILDYVGVYNVAVIEGALSRGIAEVSMEQIMLWDPDILILAPYSHFEGIHRDSLWAPISAVRNGRVYEVPIGPYNWLDRPPSVQRVLGIQWLGNLIFPEHYDFDIVERTMEFFRLFFGYELTLEEARALMANSTFKE